MIFFAQISHRRAWFVYHKITTTKFLSPSGFSPKFFSFDDQIEAIEEIGYLGDRYLHAFVLIGKSIYRFSSKAQGN